MSDNKLEIRARELLKAAGLNFTKTQILVLQELFKADKPLSREDLFEKLSEYRPDKVTIYRILEKLCKIGLVHRAYIQKRAWNYELAHHCGERQCHPHFTCNNCGDTFCLTGSTVPLVKGLKKGFIIQRQQVRIEGLCPTCS
jgi:Fur family ferric uptake transcriptional regulator